MEVNELNLDDSKPLVAPWSMTEYWDIWIISDISGYVSRFSDDMGSLLFTNLHIMDVKGCAAAPATIHLQL